MQLLKRDFTLQEIADIAEEIIRLIPSSSVICFEGELGAGKTTLISSICKRMGVIDNVSSPTFSLMNLYKTSPGARYQDIVHIDFYRIADEQEAIRAGIEEYLYSGACCLIEWPQKARGILPDHYLLVKLSFKSADKRHIEVIST